MDAQQQLSIFDVMVAFDESKADIKTLAEFKRCDVLAYIPNDALSPTEQSYLGPGNPIKDRRHKLWLGYTMAIWNYEGCDWVKAINILEHHRDNNIPAKMRVTLNFDFRPNNVLKYLKTSVRKEVTG